MYRGILAIAISLLYLTACGCTDSNAPEAAYVNARFEGQEWNSHQATATRTSLFNMIFIRATRNTLTGQDSIVLTMANVTKTGTYKMEMSAGNGLITIGGILYTVGSGVAGVSGGDITLTKFGEGRIAGTFKMTVYQDGIFSNPPRQVTDGRFDMALLE